MALFRRFFYQKPPDRLLEISERVYVFDCCFSTDVLDENEYKTYMDGIVAQLQNHYPDSSFMVFNFREGDMKTQISDILSQYDMTVMDYPRQYESCPLLPMETIHHFLRSSDSWLSLEGQQNVLLMHCERGGWPVLAFMLAGLLLYRKQYNWEQKTLEMIYKQAPKELLRLLSPLNPQPSQLRYLQYISRRNMGLSWPPSDTPLVIDSLILKVLPVLDSVKCCRPVVRVYGHDPSNKANKGTKLLFSSLKARRRVRNYPEMELVKLVVGCRVQGDVVLECVHLRSDSLREEMMFRVMFHTAFIRSHNLTLTRDEVDLLWDVKDKFPKDFRAEVLFSDIGADDSEVVDTTSAEEFFEVQEIFSNSFDLIDGKGDSDHPIFEDCSSEEGRHKHELFAGLNSSALKDASSDKGNQKQALTEVVKDINVDHGNQKEDSKPEEITKEEKDINLDEGNAKNADEKKEVDSVTKDAEAQKEETRHRTVVPPDVAEEGKQNQEDVSVRKRSGSRSPPRKQSVDVVRHKADKLLQYVTKRPPTFYQKSPPDTLALGRSRNDRARSSDALADAASKLTKQKAAEHKWIPTNKGSLNNSMHVTYSHMRVIPPPGSGRLKTRSSSVEKREHPIKMVKSVRRSESAQDISLIVGPNKVVSAQETPPPPPLPVLTSKLSSKLMNVVKEQEQPLPPAHTPTVDKDGATVTTDLQPSSPPPQSPQSSSQDPSIESSNQTPSSKSPPPPTPPISTSQTDVSSSMQEGQLQTQIGSSPPLDLEKKEPPSDAEASKPSPPSPSPQPQDPSGVVPSAASPVPQICPACGALVPSLAKCDAKTSSEPLPLPSGKSAPPPPPPPNCPAPPGGQGPPPPSKGNPPPSAPQPPPPPPGGRSQPPPSPQPPPPPPGGRGPPPPPPPVKAGGPPPPPGPPAPPRPPGGGPPGPPPPPGGGGPPGPPPPPGGGGPPPPPGAPAPPGGRPGPPGAPAPPGGAPGPPAPPGGRGRLTRSAAITTAAPRKQLLKPLHWSKVTRVVPGSLWEELQKQGATQIEGEIDVPEIEILFSAVVPKPAKSAQKKAAPKAEVIHLVDLRRANNTEIMLTKVKMPLPDMMVAALALDESILDADQVENLIKFCPTKDEMDLLKNYTGDIEKLGKCEQFFLELMKVPRVESKLQVFLFKIQFSGQVKDFRNSLTLVNSACDEVKNSHKLKQIMRLILLLGNTLNNGTARGGACGFKLDSLLKLNETRASTCRMTLMNYLSKVLDKSHPDIANFTEDFTSLEGASKIQLKSLAEEMQTITKGLEKVKHELVASGNDGHISAAFCTTVNEFIGTAETEVAAVLKMYAIAGRNADALALYFGEDPARVPFEQVTQTLLNFVKSYCKAQEENIKQAELDKKKAEKEAAELEKNGGSSEGKDGEGKDGEGKDGEGKDGEGKDGEKKEDET